MLALYEIKRFQTPNFTLVVDAVEEDLPLDATFDESVTNLDDLADKINNGIYVYFCARVRVLHRILGEIGCDYLGACCYEWFDDFAKSGYCYDMAKQAISEARHTIAEAKAINIKS